MTNPKATTSYHTYLETNIEIDKWLHIMCVEVKYVEIFFLLLEYIYPYTMHYPQVINISFVPYASIGLAQVGSL